MPLLPRLEKKQLILPSSKDLPAEQQEFVVLEVGPLLGADVAHASANTQGELALIALVNRIVEWNVKDVNGEVAAVTAENVGQLPVEDMTFLLQNFTGVTDEAAKSTDPKSIPVN